MKINYNIGGSRGDIALTVKVQIGFLTKGTTNYNGNSHESLFIRGKLVEDVVRGQFVGLDKDYNILTNFIVEDVIKTGFILENCKADVFEPKYMAILTTGIVYTKDTGVIGSTVYFNKEVVTSDVSDYTLFGSIYIDSNIIRVGI